MWKQEAVSRSTQDCSPIVLVNRIGRRIAQLRKRRRWSRRHLARRLGVSPKTIGNWELGRNQPAVPLLVALAETLEVSVDQLTRSEEET